MKKEFRTTIEHIKSIVVWIENYLFKSKTNRHEKTNNSIFNYLFHRPCGSSLTLQKVRQLAHNILAYVNMCMYANQALICTLR